MTASNQAIDEVVTENPQQIVEAFLDACSELDFDKAVAYIDDNCIYKNVPFHTAKGKNRIRRDLGSMSGAMNLFHVEMVHIAVNGNVVLTERVDTLGGRFFKAAIPLMGVFVVNNGKITEWRDYFDWSSGLGKTIGSVFTSWRR
ncbi:MAG: nuclear transport factor 2 family protein [Pseudomonadales bacterium]|nr:nuclear transport factor 2 family protein [Pseudomonadales bacterium]